MVDGCGWRLVWAYGYVTTPRRQSIGRQKWVKNGYADGYGTSDIGIRLKWDYEMLWGLRG